MNEIDLNANQQYTIVPGGGVTLKEYENFIISNRKKTLELVLLKYIEIRIQFKQIFSL